MPQHNLIGQTIGSYYLEGIIGHGTMAVIYRALDPKDNVVAMEIFVPPVNVNEELLRTRFEREARTAARLEHPNILKVLDAGQDKDFAFMVMPLIQGDTLEGRLKSKRQLSEIEAIDIGWQIADGLHHAHTQGVIHRDVKPSNILINHDGHALLADFGVAHALDDPSLTQAGHIVGTPAYISPEQAAQGKVVDGRADLYSLGTVIYRMAVGKLPFVGTTAQMLHAHVYDRPDSPSTEGGISPELESIILRAMAKNPDDRYQDGRAMAQALLRLNYKIKEGSNRPGLWQTISKWFRSRLGSAAL